MQQFVKGTHQPRRQRPCAGSKTFVGLVVKHMLCASANHGVLLLGLHPVVVSMPPTRAVTATARSSLSERTRATWK